MSKPVYVSTDQTRLAGLERRVRFLERRSQIPEGVDFGGIQFEVDNEGDWLQIGTTGEAPTGYGILLDAADDIRLRADGQISVHSETVLDLNADGYVQVRSTADNVYIIADFPGKKVILTSLGGGIEFRDQVSGNVLFRVDPSGAIHGKSSVGAITWDL